MTRTASSTTKSVFLPLYICCCLKLELAKGLEPPTL